MRLRLKKQKHVVPVISLEGHEAETDGRRGQGVYERLSQIVQKVHHQHIFFSVSLTVTSINIPVVTDEAFIQDMVNSGCKLFFFLEYTAIREGTEAWVPSDEERNRLNRAVESFRTKYPALFISVPGDEAQFGGCLSAGRGFIHITAQGDLEPCPFAPYSDINIGEMSLEESLKSPFLKAIRQSHHLLSEAKGGCALWENRDWVQHQLEITLGRPAWGPV